MSAKKQRPLFILILPLKRLDVYSFVNNYNVVVAVVVDCKILTFRRCLMWKIRMIFEHCGSFC